MFFIIGFLKAGVMKAGNFIKKRLQHACFPIKFAKFLRTPIFYRTPSEDAQLFSLELREPVTKRYLYEKVVLKNVAKFTETDIGKWTLLSIFLTRSESMKIISVWIGLIINQNEKTKKIKTS